MTARHFSGGPDLAALETSAMELLQRGRPADALKIFYRLAEGNLSLDGGYLGWRIGQCYEALGDLNAAHYWHGRAVQENPALRTLSAEALRRIGDLPLDELLITSNPPLRSYG
jgi:hypothetical protein